MTTHRGRRCRHRRRPRSRCATCDCVKQRQYYTRRCRHPCLHQIQRQLHSHRHMHPRRLLRHRQRQPGVSCAARSATRPEMQQSSARTSAADSAVKMCVAGAAMASRSLRQTTFASARLAAGYECIGPAASLAGGSIPRTHSRSSGIVAGGIQSMPIAGHRQTCPLGTRGRLRKAPGIAS